MAVGELHSRSLARWLRAQVLPPVARATAESLSSTLIARIATTARDLRQAANSGEAADPEAARRIADDLEQVASDFRDQLAAFIEP